MKFLRPVFARMWQIRRKDFLKVYIPSTCFIYLIFIVCIGGMFVLSNFFFHFSLYQAFSLGISISFLLNFFFFPFFVDLLNCISISSTIEFNQAILDVTKSSINRARKKHVLTDEQLKQLENDLEKACERFKTPIDEESNKEENKK